MKNFRIFVMMLAIVAVSCQQETAVEDNSEPVNSENENAVSKEEALEALYSELDFLYGESTRSNRGAVKDIKTVQFDDMVCSTRSLDVEIDDVLYIVEFEDGKGSAILGADKRVEDVFAVLDDGVISVEDFENAANGVEIDELNTYLAGLITEEVIEQISTASNFVPAPGIDNGLRYGYFEYQTLVEEEEECYLLTKWDQRSPYNELCYNEAGQKCVAGCVTIAAAQAILYSYPHPYDIILVDSLTNEATTFDKRLLNLKCDDIVLSAEEQEEVDAEVARYVFKLAQLLDINLQTGSSGGSTSNIAGVLSATGVYNDVNFVYLDSNDFLGSVRDQLYIRKLPAPFRGGQTNGGAGHSWVLDAYKYLKKNVYLCTVEGGQLVRREYWGVEETRKVHCNFGWSGMCDGYYTFGMFDVSNALDDSDIVGEIGDVAGEVGYYPFNANPGIIVYSL